jgi:hypothetical protein
MKAANGDSNGTMSKQAKAARSFWLKQLHTWHWMSSAICLIGMLLFAITGITLNHAGAIEADPVVSERTATLPPPLLTTLNATTGEKAAMPPRVRDWIDERMSVDVGGTPGEWSKDEVYVGLPRPGGDAWLSIDRASGAIAYELTSRGWISYLNDLHKGRNAGEAWRWFIDVFAVACLAFCVTGLILLQLHARHRPMTWPTVGLGLVVPLLIAVLFIHL